MSIVAILGNPESMLSGRFTTRYGRYLTTHVDRGQAVIGNRGREIKETGEIEISDEVALKLKAISQPQLTGSLNMKGSTCAFPEPGGAKPGYLLKQRIPVRLTEWNTSQVGYVEADMVFHCGSSVSGEYVHTLSTTEISSFIQVLPEGRLRIHQVPGQQEE